MLGTYHLTMLYDLLRDMHVLYQSEKIYSHLLENIMKALDADAASLFLKDPVKPELKLRACIGPKKQMFEVVVEEWPFPLGQGVCGWVAEFVKPVLIEDVSKDQRFSARFDTLSGYKTKSVLCAPLAVGEEVLGVVEMLNKKSSAFNKNDLDLLVLICSQAAIALHNGQLLRALEESARLNENILSNLTGGFLAVNPKGILTHVNSAAERILQLNKSACIGKSSTEILKSCEGILSELNLVLSSRQKKLRQELKWVRPDNAELRIGFSAFPIEDGKDGVQGAAIIFQDLTHLA